MRIFYDTEFLEDGHRIVLISIGMVAEDGRELYAVNEDISQDPVNDAICRHQWLMENVVPHLPLATGGSSKGHGRLSMSSAYRGFFNLDMNSNAVMPRRMIRNAVRDFILATPDPQLWAWYGAYDHVALAQLFGRMVSLPDGVPMWTNDLKQEAARLGNPPLPDQADGVHNALADARHNLVRARVLDELAARTE
ncbi:3'-5' exoribonuclease [Streptomyces sp. STCH 565 A]|uniref:3'-5' exoribonuclease n=1 Tax=Streptomyces sp. STCH 565 A TaxID=2950532 RepID=UPI002075AB38|nr:3'-5' exoribonuclease [Streptomyces sp. STCH 565 A]MCM8548929.1 3'-5' exoribonuclease [Streptomyces sp. STCH 565 A]